MSEFNDYGNDPKTDGSQGNESAGSTNSAWSSGTTGSTGSSQSTFDPNVMPTYDASYAVPPQEEQKGMSIASFVLGLCGFIACCIPLLGYPVTIVGLVLGIKGRSKGAKGLATAGIVLCIITLILTLINSILGAVVNTSDLTNYLNSVN